MNIQFRAFVPADLKTVLEAMPYAMTTATTGIVAYDVDTAETAAICLCEAWTATSLQIHQIILKTMVIRHGWFEEVARYVFTAAGRKIVYGIVPDNNPKALNLNEKLGFTEVVRLEDAYAEGVDYILMELKRENCPYWVGKAEQMAA